MRLLSPYKGLEAFGESDADALLFFGREREREIVVANLIAARLTVLYGPTGVGKSSLLRAGVARSLRELQEEPIVVVFDRWAGDASADLAATVVEASGTDHEGGLLEVVERVQRGRDVYLILDQAEEYFVYHDEDSRFESELARLAVDPLRVNILISLREDSLARLDRFKPRIPFVYANSLRLDRLDRPAGRMAIIRPVERWNELEEQDVRVEPELVEAVLDGVEVGQIEPGSGGLGALEGNGRPSAVEAPYLQLVMERLWEVEREAGSAALRAATLADLGGARRVVADHLARAVGALEPDDRDIAARLFTYLVTPSGTKIAHELPDLAEYAGVSSEDASRVVATLSRHRILRPDESGRTEIFHDVLAGEILAWRRAHAAERALEEAKRRHRRLAWVAGLASAAFLLTTLLAVFALTQRSEARAQAREAKAHELEARASALLDRDPELGLLLARQALALAPTESAVETLRNALLASRVRVVVDAGRALVGARVTDSGIVAATAAGPLVVADQRSGRVLRTVANGHPTLAASFAADGTTLLTGRDGRVRLMRLDGRVTAVPRVRDARGAEISRDASLGLVVGRRGARLVAIPSGSVLRSFPHRGAVAAAFSQSGQRVVTGAADDTLRIWSTRGRRRVRPLAEHHGRPSTLAFSPSGRYVVAGSTDGIARIWRVQGGGPVATVSGDATAVTDVAFSTDGEHVVMANKDGTVRVAKADTGAVLVVLSGHEDRVASAAFTGPAGSAVVTASADGSARIWDALFQPKVRVLAELPSPVTRVAFLRDASLRVDTRTRARALDFSTGEPIDAAGLSPPLARAPRRVVGEEKTATIRGTTVVLADDGRKAVLRGHRDRVYAVAFSPDSGLVATAGRDRDVRLWRSDTGELVRVLSHNSAVRDVGFSPNGEWLITAASRATLWDVANGTPVVRIVTGTDVATSAAFGPSGRVVATGNADGTVGTYACAVCGSLAELVRLADRRLARTGRTLTAQERERYLG